MANHIYSFKEGNQSMKDILGGKGANLAEMSSLGLPVPPGFTISAEVCKYYEHDDKPDGLDEEIHVGIKHIEEQIDYYFGNEKDPLLVSVRSGAAVSMPGMMDTILNLGLNDKTVKGLANKTGKERFAYDCYRRFINMFGHVVMGIRHDQFEAVLQGFKKERSAALDTELNADDMKELVNRYKAVYHENIGNMFPDDVFDQLDYAINAVFNSWNTKRAITYRKINQITGLLGTAVSVQAMVFGNIGEDSATGVCFTRNPANGAKKLYGEYLVNAQGEDVVAGIRTPRDISEMKETMPGTYKELQEVARRLEQHYQDMQDIEFTIQEGKLYLLQTRNGKRTGTAAIKIAVDMVDEGILSPPKAISNLIKPQHIGQLLHPQFNEEHISDKDLLGKGLPASPGAAVGKVVFDSNDAATQSAGGEQVILVRIETSPEDVAGMSAAEGVLTARGGMTSHAAVVARGWGKPCVAGCEDIIIDYDTQTFTSGSVTVHAGDWISIDGTQGSVIRGKRPVEEPVLGDHFHTILNWIGTFGHMGVRANADTPEDARRARTHGAEGIGLARTEHMFFGEERITAMRRMIISESKGERREALQALLPYQKQDFLGIFEAMEGFPVTIRLLDPPLHEFLPEDEEEITRVASDLGISPAELIPKIGALQESNPMLGHRGCRLGITYPEITEIQTQAIIEAALELKKQEKEVFPEIMVPLVGTPEEFINQREVIDETVRRIFEDQQVTVEYKVGTMIETPRAALVADKIAPKADFFSFGTNDLTQMTYGYSRDDAKKFLNVYIDAGILQTDPFQVLDKEGVGSLIKMAVSKGREVNQGLKVGICGEHGGEPSSVTFFCQQELDYVSCSPFRVPVAKLAGAQAHLEI